MTVTHAVAQKVVAFSALWVLLEVVSSRFPPTMNASASGAGGTSCEDGERILSLDCFAVKIIYIPENRPIRPCSSSTPKTPQTKE